MTDAATRKREPRPGEGRPTLYDPKYCEMVIADMTKGYSLGAFAGLIGVSRATINVWMTAHPEFLEAVSRGKSSRLRDWEGVALEMRAKGGGPGGATITMFGLKNMGAGDWDAAEKTDVNLSGKVQHSPDDAFRELIVAMEGIGRAKAAGAGGSGEVAGDGEDGSTSST